MSSFNSMLHGIREYWAPVLSVSKFESDAVLTPSEFVAAGDYLVFKCPTWSWESGDLDKRREYLPPDKQFLVSRNIPCQKPLNDLELIAAETDFDDGWFTTGTAATFERGADSDLDMLEDVTNNADDLNDFGGMSTSATAAHDKNYIHSSSSISAATRLNNNSTGSNLTPAITNVSSTICGVDEIPDLDDLVGNAVDGDVGLSSAANASADDPSVALSAKIIRTRTYDLSITYDKYYQTPRLSLIGYDEARRPLPPKSALRDISSDHANKTVTLERHPHLSMQVASIHPCRHSEVMKKMIANLRRVGKDVRVDQYLVLFLKFMSSVLPTIDYDQTMTLE